MKTNQENKLILEKTSITKLTTQGQQRIQGGNSTLICDSTWICDPNISNGGQGGVDPTNTIGGGNNGNI
ncbi:class I lanthipeptide [Aquimarina agarilytica]|uniref:class I lanthipeptide n=1 Tax=Aquimarina agarilytica TaxID=1087449 RepID=UPI0002882655|nr:class I lanthipeptide [Aquimarina agarilytica]